MNSHGLNAASINGSVGDTTVRSVVQAYSRAIGVVVGRVWRRSPVAGSASAAGTAGRAWRRSIVSGVGAATSSAGFTVRHWVRETAVNVGAATATILAQAKPVSFVRVELAGSALARLISSGGRGWSRSPGISTGQASANPIARARRRAPVQGQASATAQLGSSIYRQIPFDELAPPERVFAVQPEQSIFYVVN